MQNICYANIDEPSVIPRYSAKQTARTFLFRVREYYSAGRYPSGIDLRLKSKRYKNGACQNLRLKIFATQTLTNLRFSPDEAQNKPPEHFLFGRFVLVPLVGVEPTRYRYHGILSPARLPISPQRQFNCLKIISYLKIKIKRFRAF